MDQKTRDRFESLYSRLIVEDLRSRLGLAPTNAGLQRADRLFLMQTASILALDQQLDGISGAMDGRPLSYDVATRLAEDYGESDPAIAKAADFVLARLGNFPGRDLLRAQIRVL